MNQSQEDYVFKAFRKLYANFPNGKCIRSERPDYLIENEDKIIGVEITQIFTDNHLSSNINQKRKESLQNIVGDKLCQKLQQILSIKFILSIDLSLEEFSKNEIDKIINGCEEYLKKIQFPKHFPSLNFINYGQLPKEIRKINIFYFPSLDESFFSLSAGGVLPNLSNKNLQVILNKKHKALRNYKECDEYWLLIEEGTFFSDSFGDICLEKFDTDFEKVFLYRHDKGEVVTLK